MQSTMTMEQFLAEATRREDAKKDFIVRPKGMMMADTGENLLIDGVGDFKIKDTAHGQIASKLGIPKTYYDTMQAIPGLRAYNVNSWLGQDENKRLVRTLDGNVRALLSDRFKPVDNFLILQSALPVLAEHKDLQVKSSILSDSRMYLQVVFPRLQAEVKVGDAVQFGITLSNSEIGAGRINVQTFLYRLLCRNGAVGESLLRQNHVGRRIGDDVEDYDLYSDKTIQLSLDTFKSELDDILRASVNQARLESIVEKLRLAAGDVIEPKVVTTEKLVENVTRKFGLNKEDGKNILANLWSGNDLSRWGIANAVTALVHEEKSTDKQYDLEQAGYSLMTLAPSEWKALVPAA